MILIEVLKYLGLITWLGQILAPLMYPLGLPGEMGLVWATSLTLSIYNGLAVFYLLASTVDSLSLANVTVLMSLILVAHSLPIEQRILQKVGLRILPSTLFRFSLGYTYALILNYIYGFFPSFGEAISLNPALVFPPNDSFGQWAWSLVKFFFTIYIIILILIFFIKALDELNITKKLSNGLAKAMKPLAIKPKIMPIMMTGILLGISYGGGLLIREFNKSEANPADVIKVFYFLSLCHSLIEDTLIVMTTGAHYSGVFIGRIVFTFLIMMIVTFLLNFLERKDSYQKSKILSFIYKKPK